jgi:hypothetical protein
MRQNPNDNGTNMGNVDASHTDSTSTWTGENQLSKFVHTHLHDKSETHTIYKGLFFNNKGQEKCYQKTLSEPTDGVHRSNVHRTDIPLLEGSVPVNQETSLCKNPKEQWMDCCDAVLCRSTVCSFTLGLFGCQWRSPMYAGCMINGRYKHWWEMGLSDMVWRVWFKTFVGRRSNT